MLTDLLGRSCVCLLHMWHNIGIAFMSLALSFKI